MPVKKTTNSTKAVVEVLPNKATHAISVYKEDGLWVAALITLVNGSVSEVTYLPGDAKGVVLAKASAWLKQKLDQ